MHPGIANLSSRHSQPGFPASLSGLPLFSQKGKISTKKQQEFALRLPNFNCTSAFSDHLDFSLRWSENSSVHSECTFRSRGRVVVWESIPDSVRFLAVPFSDPPSARNQNSSPLAYPSPKTQTKPQRIVFLFFFVSPMFFFSMFYFFTLFRIPETSPASRPLQIFSSWNAPDSTFVPSTHTQGHRHTVFSTNNSLFSSIKILLGRLICIVRLSQPQRTGCIPSPKPIISMCLGPSGLVWLNQDLIPDTTETLCLPWSTRRWGGEDQNKTEAVLGRRGNGTVWYKGLLGRKKEQPFGSFTLECQHGIMSRVYRAVLLTLRAHRNHLKAS